MTHHYINLVTWRFFISSSLNHKILYIDSVSLKLLASFFGQNFKRESGLKNFKIKESAIFLVASERSKHEPKVVLPLFKTNQEIDISELNLLSVKNYKHIYIGISSPKQDKLAELLLNKFPNKEIYCLGAAVDIKKCLILDKYGLNWLYFLLSSPSRTVFKLFSTLKEIFKILFLPSIRKDFIKFLEFLKKKEEALSKAENHK